MPKIAFISNHHVVKLTGGAEVQADLLAEAMSKKDWTVYYFTKEVKEKRKYKNYILYPAPSEKKPFKDVLAAADADVYYQRGRKELTGWVGEFCSEQKKKFIFATSMYADCLRSKYFFRSSDSFMRRINNIIHYKKKGNLDDYSLWGMQQADRILCQTKEQKMLLQTELRLESIVFYNVQPFPEQYEKKKDSNTPVIIWVASLKDLKRPEVFLRLVKDFRHYHCRWVMAGRIYNKKFEKMINQACQENPQFTYMGPISFEATNNLFNEADVFVNTSKTEGFPNTFIQAWLRGVPTVSFSVDPDQFIVNYKTGLYADNRYSVLKKDLKQLLDNVQYRNELGNNAKQFASQTFLIENRMDDFIRLIQ